uniref:N-acetylgalactosaminide beta-1,3-galactosyltransferase n=1 Tax=Parastrongyloides trichosuri TaxID=131310 RepID=A0A0N4ZHJ1_PARTI
MKKLNFIWLLVKLFVIYIQCNSIKRYKYINNTNGCITDKNTRNVSYDNNVKSDFLFDKVKIFCLMITGPQYIESRVKFQKETWLSKCNDYLYVSSLSNTSLPSVAANVIEGRDTLWEKIRFGLQYVYDNYKDKFDWLLLIDDDSFVIMENLRFYLLSQNSNDLLHHGFRMKDLKSFNKDGYIQGGGGDVLSKLALEALITNGFKNISMCKEGNTDSGDVELGICLANVNVKIGESRDFLGRLRFVPGTPDAYTGVEDNSIFNSFNNLGYFKQPRGINSLSEYLISLHYLSGHNMYFIDYLLYQANVFGRQTSLFRNIGSSKFNDNFINSEILSILNC